MRPSRRGFTLLELMLVMMIMVVAAAISLPAMEAMMADGRVKAARDMVRARWADIRGLAMREGRPYKFSVTEQTGKFRIEPEDVNAPSDTDDPAMILDGELPPAVLFNNQCLVVYLADGTARDDVQLMLGKEGTRPIGLQVRALTGAVSLIDLVEDALP